MKTILKYLDLTILLLAILTIIYSLNVANNNVQEKELKEYEATIESENIEAREFLREASYKIVVEHTKNELGTFEKESGTNIDYSQTGELSASDIALCDSIAMQNDWNDAVYIAREHYLICHWEYTEKGEIRQEVLDALEWIENNI